MRRRILGVVVSVARSVAVFVAIVAGSAAIGALVGEMLWGQWAVGASMAGFIGAWLALPLRAGPPVTRGDIDHGVGGRVDFGGDSGDRGNFGGGGF